MSLIGEKFAKTIPVADTYSFNWTLANYHRLSDSKEKNECVQSPNFVLYNQECYIQWYPRGESQRYGTSDVYVRIHFEKINGQLNEPVPLKAKGFFFILNNSGQNHIEKEITLSISNSQYDWDISQVTQHNTLMAPNSNILTDGSLKLRFELIVFYKEVHISSDLKMTRIFDEKKELAHNMENQFLETKFSDVKFVFADCKELPAHKIILLSRVAFFEKMFESNMKENTSNIVEITDIKFKVFKEMLRFIYTGKVEDIDDVAFDLIKAADKYGIDNLKDKCAEYLYKAMTIENAMDTLEVANLFNADNLKNQALLFIKLNLDKMLELHNFETMAAATMSSSLFVDVLRALK